jgi:hypothetical protein
MRQSKVLAAALLAAATLIATPAVNAATVRMLGAGRSAMRPTSAVGVYPRLAGPGAWHTLNRPIDPAVTSRSAGKPATAKTTRKKKGAKPESISCGKNQPCCSPNKNNPNCQGM